MITLTGPALELAFGDAPDPTRVEARLYDVAKVHRFQQATSDSLGALPSLAGRPYSLVMRAEWAPDSHSFFAFNLMVLAP